MLETLYYITIYPIQLIIEILFNTVYYWQIGIGLTIFVVSLFVNLGSLPMFISAYKLQKKERDIQEEMAPKVKSIKANFKGAEKFMILSTYYRQNNYHPIMSLRISLSLLLEIPFFTAAYLFFSHLDMLNGMNWWIIKDLALPDGLLKINNVTINLLPILMTIFNVISCEIYMKGFKFKEKVQIYALAFVFLIILYNSPSGLVLYWTFNNLISLIRSFIIKLKKSLICLSAFLLFIIILICIKIPSYRIPFLLVDFFMLFISFSIPVYIFIDYIKNPRNIVNIKLINKLFVFSAIILVLLLSVVIPSNLISSSPLQFFNETCSPIKLLYYPFVQAIGIFLFWPVVFYYFMPKKTKISMLFLFQIFVYCCIFSILTVPDMGQISSVFVLLNQNFDGFLTDLYSLINFIGFGVTAIIISILIYKNKLQLLTNLMYIILFSIIIISFINLFKIPNIYKEYKQTIISDNNLKKQIHLSKTNKNVIIFLLDRGVSYFLPMIFNEKTELKEIYSGFTYFPNTVSYYPYTILALPSVLGGYEYIPENLNKRKESIKDKTTEGLLMLPLLFKQNNWSISVFDIPFDIGVDKILNKYEIENKKILHKYQNIYKKEYLQNIDTGFSLQKRNFLLYSFMVFVPAVFKDKIYDNGAYNALNKTKTIDQELLMSYSELYYLPEITDFNNDQNTFTFVYNLLPHSRGYLEYPDYVLTGKEVLNNVKENKKNIESYHLNMASFLLLGNFIKLLKENNVYDNTKIIIVSDHGSGYVNNTNFSSMINSVLIPFNPILFVKDFNAKGEYKTDYTFMTNADVPSIAIENIIDNPINPFTNKKITNNQKNNGALLFVEHKKWNIDHFNDNKVFYKNSYFNFVKDNVFDEKNWILDYKYKEE